METTTRRLLNAYYFRAHMYTLVPRQVREDMAWMADIGTDIVTVAVLEQDLYAAKSNIDIVCTEAARRGMKVHAVPSRWGGIVAGAPKVPSMFSVRNPDTWIADEHGAPRLNTVSGVISSVFHPATLDFFRTSLATLLDTFDVRGIVWDEVKVLDMVDWSAAARAAGPGATTLDGHRAQTARFFDEVNRHGTSVRPETVFSMFLYSNIGDGPVRACAGIPSLHYFGCDGRPWAEADGGEAEGAGKVLLGKDRGERFMAAAAASGKRSLFLIENHNMRQADCALMDRRMPDLLALNPDQLIYYYYPRNLEDPDAIMGVLAGHLRKWKR